MPARTSTRAGLVAALAVGFSLGACADDDGEDTQVDSAVPASDAGFDGAVLTDGSVSMDATVGHDAGTNGGGDANVRAALAACVERPGELPRPPTGELPCALLPPGLVIPR